MVPDDLEFVSTFVQKLQKEEKLISNKNDGEDKTSRGEAKKLESKRVDITQRNSAVSVYTT